MIKAWWPAWLIMAAIFINSSIPKENLPDFGSWDLLSKKSAHFIEYSILGAAYLRGLSYKKAPVRAHVFLGILFGFLYAFSDEWHQSRVPGRQASLMDVAIDTLGSGAGAWAWAFFSRRKTERNPTAPDSAVDLS